MKDESYAYGITCVEQMGTLLPRANNYVVNLEMSEYVVNIHYERMCLFHIY